MRDSEGLVISRGVMEISERVVKQPALESRPMSAEMLSCAFWYISDIIPAIALLISTGLAGLRILRER